MRLQEHEVLCRHHSARRIHPQSVERVHTERKMMSECISCRSSFGKVRKQRDVTVRVWVAVSKCHVTSVYLTKYITSTQTAASTLVKIGRKLSISQKTRRRISLTGTLIFAHAQRCHPFFLTNKVVFAYVERWKPAFKFRRWCFVKPCHTILTKNEISRNRTQVQTGRKPRAYELSVSDSWISCMGWKSLGSTAHTVFTRMPQLTHSLLRVTGCGS